MESVGTNTYMCIFITDYALFIRKTKADLMGKKKKPTSVPDEAL